MGMIFDIQRFCVNDGPGIRTVVFLKGCPLKCRWCHNPESNSSKRQLSYSAESCAGCRACATVCGSGVHQFEDNRHRVNFERCTGCGKCQAVCPNGALGLYGTEKSVDEIMEILLKDKKYYDQSGGGITISGGEPMLQFEFACALARSCKEAGLHVCLETSGFAPKEHFIEIRKYVDLFLFDYKVTGKEAHKRLVGVEPSLILENLKLLLTGGNQVILRCPIVPGYNLSGTHLRRIAELSRLPNVIQVDILPYHNLGSTKAKKIGSELLVEDVAMPEENKVEEWISEIRRYGGIHIVRE